MTDEVKAEKLPEEKTTVESTKEVEKLSDTDIKWRSKYKVAKDEHETAKARMESEKQELAKKVADSLKEKSIMEQKLIEAELKAQAVASGLQDMDLIKLIDTSNVKLGEGGKIEGLEQAVNDFKAKKPAYFQPEKKASTSSNAPFPKENATPNLKNAHDLSKEEYARQRSKFMAGRFN